MIPYHPRPKFSIRPYNFRRVREHPFWTGNVFAGLGALAGSSKYVDSSVYGRHGEVQSNFEITHEIGRSNLNVTVVGNAEIIDAPLIDTTGFPGLTVAGWHNSSDDTWALVSTLGGSYDGFEVASGLHSNPGGELGIFNGTAWFDATSGNASPGEWTHVAATHDGTSYRFFINGKNVGTIVGAAPNAPDGTVTKIGYREASDRIVGPIADVVIYSRALTPSEIKPLADPNDIMLDGAIEPIPTQTYFIPTGEPPPTTRKTSIFRSRIIRGVRC